MFGAFNKTLKDFLIGTLFSFLWPIQRPLFTSVFGGFARLARLIRSAFRPVRVEVVEPHLRFRLSLWLAIPQICVACLNLLIGTTC
jgi:hypothetical protein